uniref:Uncharacterized protein n=1 Tax=Cucumis melo TaxID=3656 RepID=A0A9I9E3F0_CUCME
MAGKGEGPAIGIDLGTTLRTKTKTNQTMQMTPMQRQIWTKRTRKKTTNMMNCKGESLKKAMENGSV